MKVNLYIIFLFALFLHACKPVKHTPSPTSEELQRNPSATLAFTEIYTNTPQTPANTDAPGLQEKSISPTETATNTPRAPTPTRVRPSPTATLSPQEIAGSILKELNIDKEWKPSPNGMCIWERLLGFTNTEAASSKYDNQIFEYVTMTCGPEPKKWILMDEWSEGGLGYAIPALLGWSADGKYVYFDDAIIPDGCQPLGGFQQNLRRADLTNGDTLSIPIDWTGGITLSPDSTKLVYYDWEKVEVGIYDLVTQEEQRIPFELPEKMEYWYAGNFTWSPDGQSVLFVIDYGDPCFRTGGSIRRINIQKNEVITLLEKDGQTFRIVEWTELDRVLISDAERKWWLNPVSGSLETPSNMPAPVSPTPSPTDTPEPTNVIDMSTQDGRIVEIQYYTLFGLHLFDQAYQLLSANFKSSYSESAFVEDSTNFYQVVKILEVIPAKEEMERDGGNPQAVSDNVY